MIRKSHVPRQVHGFFIEEKLWKNNLFYMDDAGIIAPLFSA